MIIVNYSVDAVRCKQARSKVQELRGGGVVYHTRAVSKYYLSTSPPTVTWSVKYASANMHPHTNA